MRSLGNCIPELAQKKAVNRLSANSATTCTMVEESAKTYSGIGQAPAKIIGGAGGGEQGDIRGKSKSPQVSEAMVLPTLLEELG